KRRPLRFEIKSVDSRARWRSHKFRDQEMVVPLIAQGRPGIIRHTRWAAVIGRKGRKSMGRLILKSGFVVAFIHPHIVVVVFGIHIFAILPAGAPAAVGTIDQIDHPFVFSSVITVVIYRY